MPAHKPVFKISPSNPDLGEIQTQPERKPDMPYAPAIRVTAPGDLLFISGATPSPLYHKHPHVLSEHNHPVSIEAQAQRSAMVIEATTAYPPGSRAGAARDAYCAAHA